MFLFFVRHFNDIDHLTPVIWKMSKSMYPVAVYCINPRYDYLNDYRLGFLKDLGVTIDYLHNEFDSHCGLLHKLLKSVMQRAYTRQRESGLNYQPLPFPKRLLGYLSGQVGTMFYKLLRFGYYDIGWARSILERSGARAICFDHIMPRLYVVSSFLKAAKEMSIPSFSLPHGVHLYTNEATKPKSTDTRRMIKFNNFDYIIVPNKLRKDLLVRSGVSAEKIFVLGCARYSEEWLSQHKKIIPRKIATKGNGRSRLKVVFLPSKPQCQVDLTRLKATCNTLAGMTNTDIMVKPHTRAGGEEHLFDGNSLPDASQILTAELCEWADVSLVVGSSVITEALMRKKPVLYLKYLHANTTLFEDLGACWTIHDENELENALMALQTNKSKLPYSETKVAKYVSEVVHGGRADKDVLGNYVKFIQERAKK